MIFIRKYLFIPVIISSLALALFVVNTLILLFKQKKILVNWKIKLGGLMIAFMGITVHGAWSSCYEMAMPDFSIRVEEDSSDIVEVNRNAITEVRAKVSYGEGQEFTYVIKDNEEILQMGRVLSADSQRDSWEEDMIIPVDTKVLADDTMYQLLVYLGNYTDPANLNSYDLVAEYPLIVYEE